MLRNIQNGKEFSKEQHDNEQKFKQLIDKRLPEHIEQKAQQLVDESFMNETYQDGKSLHWKPRKNDNESDKERTDRRALLVKSSRLIRSTEVERRGTDIVIGSDTPYSQRHNEGLAKIPKRQYMPIPGESNPLLDKAVEKFVDDEMEKIFG